jgi:hypothetical protein
MLCRRFGRRLPLFAGGAVVALGYAMTHQVGSNATYWAHISLPHLVAALGMSLAIAPLTTLVLTSVESDRAGTASGVNARSHAPGPSSPSACLAPSFSRAVPSCSRDSTWQRLRSRAFPPCSRRSSSGRAQRRLHPPRLTLRFPQSAARRGWRKQ